MGHPANGDPLNGDHTLTRRYCAAGLAGRVAGTRLDVRRVHQQLSTVSTTSPHTSSVNLPTTARTRSRRSGTGWGTKGALLRRWLSCHSLRSRWRARFAARKVLGLVLGLRRRWMRSLLLALLLPAVQDVPLSPLERLRYSQRFSLALPSSRSLLLETLRTPLPRHSLLFRPARHRLHDRPRQRLRRMPRYGREPGEQEHSREHGLRVEGAARREAG